MTHGYSSEGDLGDQSKDKRGLQGRSVHNRSASEYISGGCEKFETMMQSKSKKEKKRQFLTQGKIVKAFRESK